jgi:hypothetical protein
MSVPVEMQPAMAEGDDADDQEYECRQQGDIGHRP